MKMQLARAVLRSPKATDADRQEARADLLRLAGDRRDVCYSEAFKTFLPLIEKQWISNYFPANVCFFSLSLSSFIFLEKYFFFLHGVCVFNKCPPKST